ncbi:MAG: GyrI-like domain-containing protein [Spirochaetales bacterium]|nr:GyrI-like domain-containing protein [Spirochaetales bacterium]
MRYTTIDYRKRVFNAMNYISKNIKRDLSLEEIASAASFSMYHFHRIFKAVTGETVADFTRRLRLETAANQLFGQSFNITEIAMDCGFSSSQNFARAFRQNFGMSPSEYRASQLRRGEWVLSANDLPKNRNVNIDAEIKELPEYTVAYVRRLDPYNTETCAPAFAELTAWAAGRGYILPGKVLAIYWDNPEVTPPKRCRFDACIIVPDGTPSDDQIFTQKLSGGLYAVCHFELSPENIAQAWEDTFIWICNNGCECSYTPGYELYLNNAADHPEGKWIFDICIPLKTEM